MIQTVVCPKCDKKANIPGHLASVKCSGCGKIFKPGEEEVAPQMDAASRQLAGTDRRPEKKKKGGGAIDGKVLAGILGTLVTAAIIGVVVYYVMTMEPAPVVAQPQPVKAPVNDPDDVQWVAPEYKEIDMPLPDRKRVYNEMRAAALLTIEKPLMLPEGIRGSTERLLQAEYEREITKQAALHDVDVDDIQQIINEGDAKKWDPRPRSNAKRNGKRVYPKSWSVGYNQNR